MEPVPRSPAPSQNALSAGDFLRHPRVLACLERLRKQEEAHGKLVVSDVLDAAGHQYVNLVQKGGGVLGVALVGYTYILEQAGIRFLRLAGTSAGAINTALLAVIDEKPDPKSEAILELLCKLELFALVDGHPTARWFIKKLIVHRDFAGRLKTGTLLLAGLAGGSIAVSLLGLGLEAKYPLAAAVTPIAFLLSGAFLGLAAALAFFASRLMARFNNAGLGINPGNYFYDWIKDRFEENQVFTASDLNRKAQNTPELHLREERQAGDLSGLQGDVTFIASEIVTGNKIQFPRMAGLFRREEELDELQPAGFVRASMAIPIFFESYFINDIPHDDATVKAKWEQTFGIPPPPAVRLVDGGLLSNFPINLFFNPQVPVPRLPTFGIDLDDTGSAPKPPDDGFWELPVYLGKMLSALRSHYDKDFLQQHAVYQKGVGKIDLSKFNWLNFFLSDDDKKELFFKGAEAATDFLLQFDWPQYKEDQRVFRRKYYPQNQNQL